MIINARYGGVKYENDTICGKLQLSPIASNGDFNG